MSSQSKTFESTGTRDTVQASQPGFKTSISQQLWCTAKTTISALQFPSYLTLDKLLHFPQSVCSPVRITVPFAHGTLGHERRIFLVGSGWQLLLNNFIPSSICPHLYHLPPLPFCLCSAVQIFPFGQTQSPSLLPSPLLFSRLCLPSKPLPWSPFQRLQPELISAFF